MNCKYLWCLYGRFANSARVYTWSKKMDSKVGIISHRQGKTRPSLWDIGTCKPKIVSASLLYFENLSYNATLYSNNRKIFQRFETCKDICTRTMWQKRLWALALLHIHRDIQLPLDAVIDTFNNIRQRNCFLPGCV